MPPNNYTPISLTTLAPAQSTPFQPVSTETTPAAPATEPAMISSAQGAKVVEDTQKRLDAVAPPEPVKPETGSLAIGAPEPVTTPEAPKIEVKQDFVTYVDPETGAETTLRGDAITDKAKAEMEKKGLVMSESDTSRGDLKEATTQRLAAETELNNVMTELEQTATTDKELRAQVRLIKKRYAGRIRQQEAMNERRSQTLNTLGIRLGSRYTGGAGGTFGSIMAEEERQGLQRIVQIESDMLAAVQGAQKAAKDHNYTVFTKLTELAEKKAEEKKDAYADLVKKQEEAQKEIEDEAELIENQSAIIEQVTKGTTDPFEIFTALGGKVPFDMIKEMTDTAGASDKPITLGSADILVDPKTGKVIARGSKVGGGGGAGTGITDYGDSLAYGSPSVTVGAPTVAGLGSTYNTSSSEAQMTIDDILNKIPAQLRNTEKETELKKEQIRKQLAAGYTYQQVVDRLSGFSLQGNADKQTGNVLYNLALGTDLDVGALASLLNRGATEQAMTTVENKQLEQVDAFFANTDKARGSVKQADNVLNILNDPSFPTDKLGAFDGRVFKLNRQISPAEQVKVQQLESALQLLNAPLRVEIVGTAATASEMSKVTGFQAEILDQPAILKSKVQDLRDSVLRFHNEARSQRGLPQVTNAQLVDNKKRVQLYQSLGQAENEAVTGNMNNADFLSSGAWSGSTPAADTSATDNKGFFTDL